MMFCGIKLHTEAWKFKKKKKSLSLTVLVFFYSCLPLSYIGEPQTGHQYSVTQPAWGTCKNQLPRPPGCALSNEEMSLFPPTLYSLAALELSQEFLSKPEAFHFIQIM